MDRNTQGFPSACDINLEIEELPIRFSLFDLYSWSWFWSYKRYKIIFPSGPYFRLLSCSAVLNKEKQNKDEWLLVISVDLEYDKLAENTVTLVVPWRRNCERISFAVLQNPPASVAIKME